MLLKLDISAVKQFKQKLEDINRSAFPVAVRQTLNSAAFDVKQRTMPAQAKADFVERKANFFKANSKVDPATGFDVSSMRSMVGFISKGSNKAVDELQQQEHGGDIGGRSFIPMDIARAGGSNKKMVSPRNRLKQLKFVDPKNAKGKNEMQKFIKSMWYAGVGGLVLGEYNGRKLIWRVNSLSRTGEGNFKLTPLYTYEKGRTAKIDHPTHFMEQAGKQSAQNLNNDFIKNAEKQFEKYLK